MINDRFHELTASSKNSLEWAFTRAQHRASFRTKSAQLFLISSIDLLVGVFLAHPDNSTPLLLLQHFHIIPDQFYNLLRSEGSFEPDNAPSTPECLSQIPQLDDETEKILEESFSLSGQFNPEKDHLVRLRDLFGGILITLSRVRVLLQSLLKDGGIPLVSIS